MIFDKLVKKINIFLWVAVCLGVIIRILFFGNIPAGLNQDEVSAFYESISLYETGQDRWGNEYPVYFPSWGSGQNVLYSYIGVIFIFLFKSSSIFVLRLPCLLLSLATIFFSYKLLENIYSSKIALIGTVFLSLNPWHIMSSRWSLEANILPFFIILGLYCFSKALGINLKEKHKKNRNIIYFCFIPFAFGLYAYAPLMFVLPVFLILIFFNYKKEISNNWEKWFVSFLIFLFISGPFYLFIFKNNILKANLELERYLPFTIPLLPDSRESINIQNSINALGNNFLFLIRGFDDKTLWNTTGKTHPHGIMFIFFIIGCLWFIFKLLKEIWKKGFGNIKKKNIFGYGKILILWMFSCVPLFLFFSVNLNRSNCLQIMIPLCAGIVSYRVYQKIDFKKNNYKKGYIFLLALIFFISTYLFVTDYFINYPRQHYSKESTFNRNLDIALKEITDIAGDNKILITDSIKFNYLYVAYYTSYDPENFHQANWKQIDKTFEVYNLDNFYFNDYSRNTSLLKKEKKYYYLFRTEDNNLPCPKEFREEKYINSWVVGKCEIN